MTSNTEQAETAPATENAETKPPRRPAVKVCHNQGLSLVPRECRLIAVRVQALEYPR
jgi:hypothetical protein